MKQPEKIDHKMVGAQQKQTEDAKTRLLEMLIHLEATSNKRKKIGFTQLYFLEPSVEAQFLKQDPRVKKVYTKEDFTEAVHNDHVHTIMVPNSAALVQSYIEKYLEILKCPKDGSDLILEANKIID